MFACPMKCESGKVYPETIPCPECGRRFARRCPVCNMTLLEFKDGQFEHSDHSAKHGGTFFMAADYFHHLEGVLVSETEFRIYIYDNFTKPLKGAHTAEATLSLDGRKDAVAIPMKLSEDGTYLSGTFLSASSRRIDISARVRFGGTGAPALFDFAFKAESKKEAAQK